MCAGNKNSGKAVSDAQHMHLWAVGTV